MTMYGFDIQRIAEGRPYWETLWMKSNGAEAYLSAIQILQRDLSADIIGIHYDSDDETAEFMVIIGNEVTTYAINRYTTTAHS